MSTLPMNGVWCLLITGTGIGIKHNPTTGRKNEIADYISHNKFDALLGESSGALAKDAFKRMDVQLDLSMRTAGLLEG